MRRLLLLALLVPLASGCGWASLLFGGSGSSSTHTGTAVAVPSDAPSSVPRWIELERLPKKAIPGAKLFADSGCTACHTYAGSGSANLGAPDLSAVGTHHLGIQFEIDHLKCPSCANPGSPMPKFASLGKRPLHQLAEFLEASKGIR
jgi:hypothetical protein